VVAHSKIISNHLLGTNIDVMQQIVRVVNNHLDDMMVQIVIFKTIITILIAIKVTITIMTIIFFLNL